MELKILKVWGINEYINQSKHAIQNNRNNTVSFNDSYDMCFNNGNKNTINAWNRYDNPGDSMVLFAAVIFGKKKGMVASAIGMSLADLLLGYAYYIAFTFVIKGIRALIATTIDMKGKIC